MTERGFKMETRQRSGSHGDIGDLLNRKKEIFGEGGSGKEEIFKASKKTVRSPDVKKKGEVALEELMRRMMSELMGEIKKNGEELKEVKEGMRKQEEGFRREMEILRKELRKRKKKEMGKGLKELDRRTKDMENKMEGKEKEVGGIAEKTGKAIKRRLKVIEGKIEKKGKGRKKEEHSD